MGCRKRAIVMARRRASFWTALKGSALPVRNNLLTSICPRSPRRRRTTAISRFASVHGASLEWQQWVDMTRSESPRRMTGVCAKPPFVMARQTSLHHRSNQTRNRHGWRCLAERKLRLRVRQYGERYLWFEIHLAPPRITYLILHRYLTFIGSDFRPARCRPSAPRSAGCSARSALR